MKTTSSTHPSQNSTTFLPKPTLNTIRAKHMVVITINTCPVITDVYGKKVGENQVYTKKKCCQNHSFSVTQNKEKCLIIIPQTTV